MSERLINGKPIGDYLDLENMITYSTSMGFTSTANVYPLIEALDAECEEKVKKVKAQVAREIFEKTEEDFEDIQGTVWRLDIAKFRWQDFKSHYLPEGEE